MHIEIDQSGKIERSNQITVLAFSNHVHKAIVIPAAVKKECIALLRREGLNKQTFVFQIFAAGVFLLLEEHLDQLESITIDVEYPGREGDIKGMLLNAIWRVRQDFSKSMIHFRQVGKKSGAHYHAYGVYTGTQAADHTVTVQEILAVLGK